MYKITITILTMLFLFSGCDKKENSTTQTQIKQETEVKDTKTKENKSAEEKVSQIAQATKFTITTIEGKELHLAERNAKLEFEEFKNRPIFVIFFGHRCPPCLREIPELIELTKEHKDLAIVAFEVQGLSSDQLKEFAKIQEINYNLITLDNGINFVNYIQRQANWNGAIPFILGVNKQSVVKIVHVGGVNKQQLEMAYTTLTK
ncbi:MAG: TlpA family protein disulfide reductase [Epsilonproteobacteria bacterium]|nr:TlpA family protein disulfide reductase [Campylobacterota bacterium]